MLLQKGRRHSSRCSALVHSTPALFCAELVLHLGAVESREYNWRVQLRIFTFEQLVAAARMA